MFNKYLTVFVIASLLLTNVANASPTENIENSFNALLMCMNSVTIDQDSLPDLDSQQVALLSVLNNLTENDGKVADLDASYTDIYKQVENHCAEQIQAIKTLSL